MVNPGQRPPASGRFFYGWRMMARLGIMRSLSGGLHVFGFSVFFLPITRDLGLSRAATSLIFSLSKVESAFEGPIVGQLIDRLGPRAVIIAGCLLAGVGYLLLSQTGSFITLLIVYTLIITIGIDSAFQQAPMALANNWFVRRRAVAMGLISSAVSLGGTLFTPLLGIAVLSLGWRAGTMLVGFAFLAVGLPIAWGLRSTPESVGLSPLGQEVHADVDAHPQPRVEAQDFTVREALHSAAFWTLVLASTLRLFGFNGFLVHFIPIMVWKGIAETTAFFYLSAMAFLAIPMHTFMGWLADRWPKPRVLALGMASGGVAMLVLLYGGTGTLWLVLPLFVPVETLFPVTWATVGEFFGRRNFGTIRGLATFFWAVGPVAGPVFAGRVYDTSGSYTLALQVSIVTFFLSALVFWMLRRPGTTRRSWSRKR